MSRVWWHARVLLAICALAAGTIGWAAAPVDGAGGGARPALIAAVGGAVLGAAQLGVRMLAGRAVLTHRSAELYVPPVVQAWQRAWAGIDALPWQQIMIVAVVVLEGLHRSRPWHTAVLGLVLLGYLLAVHLAETGARPSVLRRQLALIATGLGLAALSAGAALLPAAGAGSGWLSAIAAVAAVIAAGLALPV
jgi:hypothetical protein